MSLKSVVKRILPPRFVGPIGTMLMHRRERRLARMPLGDAFNAVYQSGMWKQGNSVSGKGSEGLLAERYVDLVREYAATHGLRTVVDGGCGDFAVGSRLAPSFQEYTALDVSSHIIDINRRRYAEFAARNVRFEVADLTIGTFPPADLILIREVLQHLTNAQIHSILRNLQASTWRRALISESVHDPDNNPIPNLDLPSHTVRTRTSLLSGVFLDRPPFSLASKRIATLYSSDDAAPGSSGLLVIELSRDDRGHSAADG